MTMAPVPVDRVVATIAALMQTRATGVFQLSGPRDLTYLDAGRHLAERAGVDPGLVSAGSVAEANMPTGAAPPYASLDASAPSRERFGIVVPDAFEAIDAVMAR